MIFLLIYCSISFDYGEAPNESSDSVISLKEISEYKKIILKEGSTIDIQDLPRSVTISLVGRYINIQLDSNIWIQILPNIDCEVFFNVSSHVDINLYNKFPSNLVYQTKIKISIQVPSKINFLPSIWPDDITNFIIFQYSDLYLSVKTDVLPVMINTLQLKAKTELRIYNKRFHAPFKFTVGSSLLISSKFQDAIILFDNFITKGDNCSIISKYLELQFGTLNISTIYFINTNFIAKILSMSFKSQLHCEKAQIDVLENQYVTDKRGYYIFADDLAINTCKVSFKYMPKNDIPFIVFGKRFNPELTEWKDLLNPQMYNVRYQIINENNIILKFEKSQEYYKRNFFDVLIADNISKNEKNRNMTFTPSNISILPTMIPNDVNKMIVVFKITNKVNIKLDFGNKKFDTVEILSIDDEKLQEVSLYGLYMTRYLSMINLNVVEFKGKPSTINIMSVEFNTKSINRIKTIIANNVSFSQYLHGDELIVNDFQNLSSIDNNIMTIDGKNFLLKNFQKIILYIENDYFIYNISGPSNIEFHGQFTLHSYYKDTVLSFQNETDDVTIFSEFPIRSLVTSTKIYISSLNQTFDESSILKIGKHGSITSDFPVEFNVRKLFIEEDDALQNVTLIPRILNFSVLSMKKQHDFSCEVLIIDSKNMGHFKIIKNVSKIIVDYSISRLGYIYAEEFSSYNNQGLNIILSNLDDRDQIIYNDDTNNFSVDFLCSNTFNVNISKLQFNFSSTHWNFDGSTRLFDADVTKDGNKTCLSIVDRKETSNIIKDPFWKRDWFIYTAAGVSAFIIILTIIIIVTILFRRKKKKEIDVFVSDISIFSSLPVCNI